MSDPLLTIYVVFWNPSDYPHRFVVRPQHVTQAGVRMGEVLAVERTIEAARRVLPKGALHMRRMPDDDPAILETWL